MTHDLNNEKSGDSVQQHPVQVLMELPSSSSAGVHAVTCPAAATPIDSAEHVSADTLYSATFIFLKTINSVCLPSNHKIAAPSSNFAHLWNEVLVTSQSVDLVLDGLQARLERLQMCHWNVRSKSTHPHLIISLRLAHLYRHTD